jgi:hypothetical protein
MERGLAPQDLAKQPQAAIPPKGDIVASAKPARTVAPLPAVPGALTMEIGDQGAYRLRDVAHTQIAEWSGIPAEFCARIPQEAPVLLAENVNRRLEDGEKRMFRTIDSRMRALLPNRYRRIETAAKIAQAALPILHEAAGLQIRVLEITQRRMHIYATGKTVQEEATRGSLHRRVRKHASR